MPPEKGQPVFLAESHALGSQFALPTAAGLAFALVEQQVFASPAAAGFAFAALAAAIGHFERSQSAGSQLDWSHDAAVALAFTFSVLLQPIIAKPSTATRVRVSSCFIEFSMLNKGEG